MRLMHSRFGARARRSEGDGRAPAHPASLRHKIIMVPIEEGLDDRVRSRPAHFGQEDHVRSYGRDLRDRLREAEFSIREWVSREPYVLKHGLRRGERVFLCT